MLRMVTLTSTDQPSTDNRKGRLTTALSAFTTEDPTEEELNYIKSLPEPFIRIWFRYPNYIEYLDLDTVDDEIIIDLAPGYSFVKDGEHSRSFSCDAHINVLETYMQLVDDCECDKCDIDLSSEFS